MVSPIRIAAISGSLRKASINTAVLRTVAEIAPDGVEIDIVSIADVPLYNGDVQDAGFPAGVTSLQQALLAADGVLIASPEYNHSVPGVLKNTIDWLSRTRPQPFEGKPVAIVGASPGRLGTVRMQEHLRQMLAYLEPKMFYKPELMIGGAHRMVEGGVLTDAPTRERLGRLLDALCGMVRETKAAADPA